MPDGFEVCRRYWPRAGGMSSLRAATPVGRDGDEPHPVDVPSAELSFQSLDLADLDQVKDARASGLAGPRIDVLINNAG